MIETTWKLRWRLIWVAREGLYKDGLCVFSVFSKQKYCKECKKRLGGIIEKKQVNVA